MYDDEEEAKFLERALKNVPIFKKKMASFFGDGTEKCYNQRKTKSDAVGRQPNRLVNVPEPCKKCTMHQCSLHCRWLDDYKKATAR